MSQEILVVKVDARNYGNRGTQNVCRIQPAAQADLENPEIRARFREVLKGHRGYALKIRGMSAKLARRQQLLDYLLNFRERFRKIRIAYLAAVHTNALIDFFEVWRGV